MSNGFDKGKLNGVNSKQEANHGMPIAHQMWPLRHNFLNKINEWSKSKSERWNAIICLMHP